MERLHLSGEMITRGTREELIGDLEDSAIGWHHFGKDKLRDQCFQAAELLRAGSDSANAGHTCYVVT